MKKDVIRKAVAVAFIGLAATVLAFVLLAASRHGFSGSPGDRLIIASPLVAPVICILLSLLLYPTPRAVHPVRRGLLWGSFVGANAFLILLAVSVLPRVNLISQDGTAYWGLLFLPGLWIGIPFLSIGTLIGLIAGVIVNKNRHKDQLPSQSIRTTS